MTLTYVVISMLIASIITTWAFTALYFMRKIGLILEASARIRQETLEEALIEHHDRCLLATYETVGSVQDFKTYCERVNNAIRIDVASRREISKDVDKLLFVKAVI